MLNNTYFLGNAKFGFDTAENEQVRNCKTFLQILIFALFPSACFNPLKSYEREVRVDPLVVR